MEQLIQALTILLKYGNPTHPTHCEHDELTIVDIDPKQVTEEDKAALNELGFFVSGENFKSFRFGSA